jgi:hypothetical protein
MASGHASARVIPFIDTAKMCAFVSCQSHKVWWLTILGILGGFAALAGAFLGGGAWAKAEFAKAVKVKTVTSASRILSMMISFVDWRSSPTRKMGRDGTRDPCFPPAVLAW